MNLVGKLKDLQIVELDEESSKIGFGDDKIYSNGECNILYHLLERNDVVFDVGCNKGEWTKMVLAFANPKMIYAFEPIQNNYEMMYPHYYFRNNVKPFLGAMSNVSGKAKMKWYKNSSEVAEMSNMFGRPEVEKKLNLTIEEVEVNTSTIDDFANMNDVDIIDFLKIDTEGAEQMVLEGAHDYLKNNAIKYIQFEYGGCFKDSGATLKQCMQLLSNAGYSVYRMFVDGIISIKEWTDDLENYQHSNYFAICPQMSGDFKSPLVPEAIPNDEEDLVSIIIPTYNRLDLLPKAISHALSQSYTNVEVVVVNDAGSSVRNIIAGFQDTRLILIEKEKNQGLGSARNTGIKASHGKWIAYCDDDDWLYTFHVSTLMKTANESNSSVVYSTSIRTIQLKSYDGTYKVIGKDIPYNIPFDKNVLLYQNITPVLAVMHKRECYDNTSGFDEQYRVYEDWVEWIEMSRKYDFAHISKPTSTYTFRMDGSTMSSSRPEFRTLLPVIYKRFEEYADPSVLSIQNEMLKNSEQERL